MSGTSDDGTISYNYPSCQNIYDELQQDQATISTQIHSLEDTIKRLRLSWNGLSAAQWQDIQNRLDAAIGIMAIDLQKMTDLLPEMTSNMQYADKQAADRIARIGQP